MADLAEFYEGTADLGAADNDVDACDADEADESAWQHHECEVVVCLVDCSTEMFRCSPPPPTRSNEAVPDASGSTRLPGEGDPSPRAGNSLSSSSTQGSSNSNGITEAETSTPTTASFFSMTLQSIRTLLTEKIVWTNKDKVAVVLYNTRECANAAAFSGIYVTQDATHIGTQCIQRVEHLGAAGNYGSPAYDEFVKTIGHVPRPAPSRQPRGDPDASVQAGGAAVCRFSDVLWVARHIFLNACEPETIQHQRLFVFTNESDPTQGRSGEWKQCRERVRALADVGATLEVFGFGDSARPTSTGAGILADPTSIPISDVAHDDPNQIAHSSFALLTAASPTASYDADRAAFDSTFFWEPLLKEMEVPSVQPTAQSPGERNAPVAATAALAAGRPEAYVSGSGMGAVHIHAGTAALHQLLSTVARRAHPQRPFRRCLLRIGRLIGQDDGGGPAAATAPRMAVSLYTPLLRARPPPHEWLDRQTNRAVRRVVHLHTCKDDAREEKVDETAEVEVSVEQLGCYAKVGGDRVCFTKQERQKITEVAAGDAEAGFTILLFKDVKDVLQHAHVVRRSSFLHVCVEKGGPRSHHLFVLLVRRLRAKGRAAIAQYRSTTTAAPRLVALVPSPDLRSDPAKRYQVPAEGLGLYVVPLPFAEDLRRVPQLSSCALASRLSTPCLEDSSVDPAHLELAKEVVAALTEPYNTDDRRNPALQRQYAVLQRLAQQRYPLHHSIFESDDEMSSWVAEGNGEEKEGNEVEVADAEPHVVDSTVLNPSKMLSHAHCFHVFNREVLGSDYSAAAYCPPPSSAPHAVRRPRTGSNTVVAEGMGGSGVGDEVMLGRIKGAIRDAAARNAWDLLTVSLLKEYLSLVGVNVGAARRKADLIELAKTHVLASTPST
ncbi:putative Ku70 protein [Leptomonas pyrrhocoris]|uniref:Putative Ku70 protein n=1 Tax=Leptomonas pyrrhocoris TaxID=157538 RepID=A0A0M9G1T3_LEPPY|nr:putative Ku70 protein [Leptomonas pyrrhocoris]KPA80457.1 putative Ku70 protein [Leptomonas pyrrhocoris]|eukprot:XP_015658896.1 putative Ku70 protein [Leptomonas pyrrhocoris]